MLSKNKLFLAGFIIIVAISLAGWGIWLWSLKTPTNGNADNTNTANANISNTNAALDENANSQQLNANNSSIDTSDWQAYRNEELGFEFMHPSNCKVDINNNVEIFDTGMINTAKYLCRKGYLSPPFYFNIILGSIHSTQARMSDLCYLVNLLPSDTIWAGGGIGIFQLVVNTAAIIMGGHVRVGIEDNIWYDYGKKELSTNKKSIQRLRRIATELGREIAAPGDVREMLGLSSLVSRQT